MLDQIFVNTKAWILEVSANFLPDWLLTIKGAAISITAFAVLGPVIMMYLTLMERKVVGRMSVTEA